jgi:hypothetical protein
MIINGHPDILRGPMGLSGFHGFGDSASESAAYQRFLPENGGLGIDALYQEIRDFVSTHTAAEIDAAAEASGVSYADIANATGVPRVKIVDYRIDYAAEAAAEAAAQRDAQLAAQLAAEAAQREADSQAKQLASEAYYWQKVNEQRIDYAAIDAAKAAADAQANEFRVQAGIQYGNQTPVYSAAAPAARPTDQEIRDFVSNKTQAEIRAAMARTGITRADITQAFLVANQAGAGGNSPAYTNYLNSLPKSGGSGFDPFYKEILDYQNTHTHAELLTQMALSGVSQVDVNEANAYADRVTQQAQVAGNIAVVATDATATTIAQGGNMAAIAAAAADAKRATAEAAALAAKAADLTKTRQAAVAAQSAQVSATAAVKTTKATTPAEAASAAAAAVTAAAIHAKAVTTSAVTTATGTGQSQGSGLTFGVILTALAAYLFMG